MEMGGKRISGAAAALMLTAICLFISAPHFALAADEDPLQDFCVADMNSKEPTINGFPCKPVADTKEADFKFAGLSKMADTSTNKLGAVVTPAFVTNFTGLNTLGLGLARIDFGKGGLNPPHTHPRATEVFFLVEGSLEVGFVSTANVLFKQTLNKGELFIFPRGLVHFQKNVGYGYAWGIAALNSQNPGTQQSAKALFGSKIPSDVLQQAFGIDAGLVEKLEEFQM